MFTIRKMKEITTLAHDDLFLVFNSLIAYFEYIANFNLGKNVKLSKKHNLFFIGIFNIISTDITKILLTNNT